ncbi:MAG: chemotaxis protein CheD [Candidatus Riflebacteria bacterium]|nr:chemotaxis protein CheD [Candidatus Riflebacteria bacterium]
MPQTYSVGMAELRIARTPDVLASHGIGSCIIAIMYDPSNKIGGLVHVMLPDSSGIQRDKINPRKFADSALPLLYQTLLHAGADKKHLWCKLVGGAEMFPPAGDGFSNAIGAKNLEASQTAVAKIGIPLLSMDVGGRTGRSLSLDLENGRVSVSILGRKLKEI